MPLAALIFFPVPARSAAAPAVGLTLEEILTRIQDSQSATQTLQFSFVQTDRQGAEKPRVTSGEVHYRKPLRLRIEEQRPDKQIIVTDGTTLRAYSRQAGQVLEGSWPRWIEMTGFPSVILSFLGDLPVARWGDRYDVFFGGHEDGLYRLRLKATQGGQAIDLWVSDDTFLLRKGRLAGQGYVRDVTLSNLRQNVEVQDSLFRLRVPSGTPVIPLPS